ncbi:glycerate kinase [Kocuria rhizophila]|nr:glycerate kinase [Kocuria rhizophila]
MARADLLVTGEGSLDEQSLGGKTPLRHAAGGPAPRGPGDRRVRSRHLSQEALSRALRHHARAPPCAPDTGHLHARGPAPAA